MSLIPLLIVAVAHVPLLVVYFQQLWDRPHYQFFPLVLVAAGYFIYQRWPLRSAPTRLIRALSSLLLLICVGLLTYAFLRLSPIFAYVSFVALCGIALMRLGVPALGPWMLLWLVVRVPYGQDVALIQWMQRITTRLSGTALESIGIEHIVDGNVLRFPTTSLFVEEACSGVVSLLAIVACAGILAVWWRRAIVHSLLLVTVAIFLAGAMNVVRVVAIAIALDSFDINLAEGWRHEMLGLCVFAVSLLGLFSTDRFLYFLLGPIPLSPLAGYWDHANGNIFVKLWNRYVGWNEPDEEDWDADPEPEAEPPASVSSRWSVWHIWDWGVAVVFVLLAGGQVMAGIGPFSVAPDISSVALELNEEALPPEIGEWERVGFENVERDSSSAFGEHSRVWAYQKERIVVRISVDFVFPEWHALTSCYKGIGWNLEKQTTQQPADATEFVEATFTKPNGDWALLVYDLFDDEGRAYEAPSGSFIHPKLRRVFRGDRSRWNLPNYYQVQALCMLEFDELSSAERDEVRELFLRFRTIMIQQVGDSPAG